METRLHCLDVDLAYEQMKKKLDRALTTIKDLQKSLGEGAQMLGTMMEKASKSAAEEREALGKAYADVYEKARSNYEAVARSFDDEFQAKNGELTSRLLTMSTNLPIVQSHFLLCSIFASRADKFEFLTMTSYVVERLATLAKTTLPPKLPNAADFRLSKKSDEFLDSLETDILDKRRSNKNTERPQQQRNYFEKCDSVLQMQLESLNDSLGAIKGQLSTLHAEISTKRRLSTTKSVSTLSRDCLEMKSNLDRVTSIVDEQNRLLLAMWEEDRRRIAAEQAAFKRRVSDLSAMNAELARIICISEHLSGFINSGAIEVQHEDDDDHKDNDDQR